MNNPDHLTALLMGDAAYPNNTTWQGLIQEHWGNHLSFLLNMKDDPRANLTKVFDRFVLKALTHKIVPPLEGHQEYDAAYHVQSLYRRVLANEDVSPHLWQKKTKQLTERLDFYLTNGHIEKAHRLNALHWATQREKAKMAPIFALNLAMIDDRLHPQARAVTMAWIYDVLFADMNHEVMSAYH